MLDGDEVGVCTCGALRGEAEHARPEGSEQAPIGGDAGGGVQGVEVIEERHHPAPRTVVGLPAGLDHGGVAHPEAEDESAGVPFVEVRHRRGERGGVVHPDADDAADHRDLGGGRQQALEALREPGLVEARRPQRAVAEGFHLGRDIATVAVLVTPRAAPPDPDTTEVHGLTLSRLGAL